MKNIIILLLVIANISNGIAQKKIPPEKPKLIIGIVVSQMRYDYMQKYWGKFGENGFKRLLKEGAVCKNASHDYLFTQTAVGHASIFTGTTPSNHGIISDYWYELNNNRLQYCVDDLGTKSVGTRSDVGRRSPKQLMTATICDEIKLSTQGKSKVFGVSIVDNSAILSAGYSANGAFWYDDETGEWITSTYYMDEAPKWLNTFNKKKYPDLYLEKTWNTLLPIEEYTESLPDSNIYETSFGGRITFPYNLSTISALSKKQKNYGVLKTTPWGNTYTKDLAIATIINEELGKDEFTDVLSISFASTEFIGLRFGPTSVEIEDAFLRLDKEIAFLLTFIDETIGKENVLVFLTSDHGVAHIPKYLKDSKIPSGKFNHKSALALLRSYLNATYGEGDWVKGYNEQQIFLNHNLIEDAKLDIKDVQEKVANFLIQFSAVSNTVTAHTLQTTNFSDGILNKIQNSYNQKRSGDVIINLKPGWIPNITKATSHNSAYSYDTHVPLVFYGWKIYRKSVVEPVSVTDIAPTISNLMKLSAPNGSTGNVIKGIAK